MKLQHVPLSEIVDNPWRNKKLYPLDEDHVQELRESIKDHGFFASVKGRRVAGKVEIGCGHARIAAARKARLETVPVFIDELNEDQMLWLMTDENALQQVGANPGAVMNEVVAVTMRCIDGLFASTTVEANVAKAFESKAGIDRARSKLRNGSDAHLALGENVIRAYLGQGNADRSRRSGRQIREAISALKQSGLYDDLVEEALRKYPPPVDAKPAKGKEIIKTKPNVRRRRLLDERTANVFKTEGQFHAFREAVTTSAAQIAIPVDEQLALAKEIMRPKPGRDDVTKKTIPGPYIKIKIQERVQEFLKEQRKIDKEERDRYLAEQIENQIDEELDLARRWLRSLISSLAKLSHLAEKYPKHPKLGGFSAKLDDLIGAIKQLRDKLK